MSGNPGKRTDPKVVERVKQLLRSGVHTTAVAKRTGLSNSLVRMFAAELKQEPKQGETNDNEHEA